MKLIWEEPWETVVDNPVGVVDDAAVDRLRDAITAEDVAEDEQLQGVLRMLGKEMPREDQLPLFNRGPGQLAHRAA